MLAGRLKQLPKGCDKGRQAARLTQKKKSFDVGAQQLQALIGIAREKHDLYPGP
jgi:hypothetical protein